MKKYLYLMVGFFVLMLTGCAEYYETESVKGKIVDMEFDKGHWEKKKKTVDGQTKTTRKWVDDEWEITVEYNGKEQEFEFNNDKIYKKFKKGDSIDLELKVGYSEKHEIVSESFDLPEELSHGLK